MNDICAYTFYFSFRLLYQNYLFSNIVGIYIFFWEKEYVTLLYINYVNLFLSVYVTGFLSSVAMNFDYINFSTENFNVLLSPLLGTHRHSTQLTIYLPWKLSVSKNIYIITNNIVHKDRWMSWVSMKIKRLQDQPSVSCFGEEKHSPVIHFHLFSCFAQPMLYLLSTRNNILNVKLTHHCPWYSNYWCPYSINNKTPRYMNIKFL